MHSSSISRSSTPMTRTASTGTASGARPALSPKGWFELLDTGSLADVEQAVLAQPGLLVCRDDHDMTALARAIERNHDGLADLLVRCGAGVNAPVRREGMAAFLDFVKSVNAFAARTEPSAEPVIKGIAALHANAPLAGCTEMSLAVFRHKQALIGALVAQAGPALLDGHDGLGCTALTRAIQERGAAQQTHHSQQTHALVEHLLALGADPNVADARDRTPLMHAAWAGDGVLADTLIRRGARFGPAAGDGATPLALAALAGHDHLLPALLDAMRADGALDHGELRRQGVHALSMALLAGQQKAAGVLLVQGCAAGVSPEEACKLLGAAAQSGALPVFEAAWRHLGATVRTSQRARDHALMLASRIGSLDVVTALATTRKATGRAPRGEAAPLIQACAGGHLAVAKLLVSRGASLQSVDPCSGLPVICAAALGAVRQGHGAVLHLLLTHAPPGSSFAAALNAAGACADHGAIDLLLAHGVPVDGVDADGHTPLSAAAAAGSLSGVRYLLQQGADVTQGPPLAHCPLACAAASGSAALVDELLAYHGDDAHQRGQAVERALHSVIERGDVPAMHLLLQSKGGRALSPTILAALDGWTRLGVTAGSVDRSVLAALSRAVHAMAGERELQ